MSETLTFGPQWLRALSSGNSVTSPPPSPGPKYKMAEYRYGKEEMLALFIEDLVKPIELDHFSSISKTKSHFPLAFIPPTEEEQRYSLGSVNSNAVLKLMGRGAPRGAARGVRGGLGGRGRGRGDGGYMRQSSYEDSRPETGGFRDPRRQGWEESRRGGFDRGNASGRGYDPTMRGRLSSDTTWDKNDKGHENWRSGVQHDAEDDGGGWRVSGQRSFDKSDRWRGGSKISRSTSWRNSDSFRDEKNFGEEEWQVARGPRARSFHERDDRPWNHPSEPEWCKDDDFEDLDVAGTFDSSGAFRSQKKEETRSDASVKELNNQEAKLQTDGKDENVHEQKEPNHNENRSNDEKPHTKQQIEEKSTTASGGLTSSGRPVSELTTSTTQENVQVTSVATTSQPAAVSTSPTHKTDEKAPQFRLSAAKSEEREVNDESESDKKEDEPNMEHFAKAAENLVMSLDDEVEKSDPDSQPPGFHAPPVTAPTSQLEEIKWFYTDPQGKMQGPFTNTEMADWFNHGYFTMSLMIKRSIDEAFQPLGELIKSWGRVPFLPGPQPPPLKGMPDQIQQQQHLLAQQQQYQQLLQQHMIQQRFLQQQAIIMQQQLQMHRQQEQQAPTTTTSPHSTSSHMEVPPPHLLQTTLEHQQHLQALQQQQLQQHQLQQQLQQQQQQQQQQQRPQALSVSSESIWGGSGTTSTSPGMSPGPWSPVSTASPASTVSAAARGWDVEHGNKEKIQSLQEIQRIEEEKERAIKLEKERREAALRQEEELRKRQQQEFLMQRQREEEERRRQEETEKKKREQEEILKKQQEEELRKQQQLAERQKQVEEQKRQMEEQKMIEMRKQQQQALVRLQQQQQELQRRKEIELQKQKELQLKLQQKRQQSQNGSSTLWGPAPASAAPSLTEIQQQQEKRERNAQQEKERVLQHEREQQQRNAAATAGWTERNSKGPSNVKSLVEIQQEQERQLAKKQNQQLSRSHPQQQSSHNPFSSSVWGNNSSVLSSWAAPTSTAASTNAWGGASKMGKQTTQFAGNDDDDDDDDDDEDDDEEESFWDEAVKEAKKAGQSKQQPKQQQQQKKQQQQQQPKGQFVQHKNKQPSNAAFPGLGNKCQAKRPNKDEENVRRIFQQQASASDEFAGWFEKSLRTMKVTSIDIPTFFAFLKDVESPYEVHDYVKSYVGDSKEAHEFARDFIEQRKQAPSRKTQNTQPLPEDSVWGNGNPKPLPSKTCGNQQQQQQPQEDYVQNVQADSTTNKRKKKKKMQKVDPRILGFSVNAAERVNIGEIQTLEDA